MKLGSLVMMDQDAKVNMYLDPINTTCQNLELVSEVQWENEDD